MAYSTPFFAGGQTHSGRPNHTISGVASFPIKDRSTTESMDENSMIVEALLL